MVVRKFQARIRIDPRKVVVKGARLTGLAKLVLEIGHDFIDLGIIVGGINGTHYIARHALSDSDRLIPYSTANKFYALVTERFRRGRYRMRVEDGKVTVLFYD